MTVADGHENTGEDDGTYVGNPFYQTPKRKCETHRAYDILDLTELRDDYLPRTN